MAPRHWPIGVDDTVQLLSTQVAPGVVAVRDAGSAGSRVVYLQASVEAPKAWADHWEVEHPATMARYQTTSW